MKIWTLLLSALALAVPSFPQTSSTRADLHRFNGFTLPVEVSKTIKAEKAEAGDPVQFHMLEPVLAGNGVVIPAKAKVYGKVVLSTRAADGQYSYLALVVERAEWDGHTVSLRAFPVGWEKDHSIKGRTADCPVRASSPSGARPSPTLSAQSAGAVFDQCSRGSDPSRWDDTRGWSQRLLAREVDIYRDASSGSTVLVSKKNVHLPAGTLILLQDVSEPSLAASK